MVRRYQELVVTVPDLHASELSLIENDRADHRATFEYVQTGTLAGATGLDGEARGVRSPFVVHTTMFVRFDDDGRMAALRTVHR